MKNQHKYLLPVILLALAFTWSCRSCKKEVIKEEPAPPAAEVISVTFVSPKGATYRPASIVASFSTPMVPITTIGRLSKSGPIILSPEVAGEHHWLGTQTVSFVPDKPFPFATKYTVKIDEAIADIGGTPLSEPMTWEFETARPLIISTSPEDEAKGVGIDENILLEFNQPIDPKTVSEHLKLSAAGEDGKESELKADVKRPADKEWKELERDQKEIDRAVIVHPANKLPLASRIMLSIDEGLTGPEGDLTAGKVQTAGFSTYEPLKIKKINCTTDCNPKVSISIEFNNEVKPREAIKHVKIEPAAEIRNNQGWDTSYFYIYGDFKPSTSYKVTLSPGLTDIHGNKLGKEEVFTYATSHIKPYITMTGGFGVMEAGGPKDIGAKVANVSELKVKLRKIEKEGLVPLIAKPNIFYTDPFAGDLTPGAEEVITVTAEADKETSVSIPLAKGLNEAGLGMVILDVTSPEVHTTYEGKEEISHFISLIQATDIGITAKFSPNGLLIWLSTLSAGTPIEGARVDVRNKKNEVVWEGVTNAEGLAETKIEKEKRGEGNLYVFAEKDGDLAFGVSNWSQGFYPWDFGIWGSYGDEGLKAYIFTERGIYKPGETIHLKALVRRVTDKGVIVPKGIKGEINAADGRSRNYFSKEINFSVFGTATVDIEIPPYAATGHSNIELNVSDEGSEAKKFYFSMNIAVYKPAEFKVDITPASTDCIAGEEIAVAVKAEYLFGEPMKESGYKWSVYKQGSSFAPKDLEKYSFGMTYLEDVAEDEYGFMKLTGKEEGRLDENGEVKIAIPTKAGEISATTDFVVEATVTDINKKDISNRALITLHPGSFYVGLAIPSFITAAGEAFDADIISVDTEGKIVEGKKVNAKLFKREWHSVRKKAVVGYTFETKPVDTEVGSCNIGTGKEAAKCTFTPKTSGFHFVKASSADQKGNPVVSGAGLYATGVGEAAWKPDATDRVELAADKKEYAPGDTARILIKSPFDTCQALLTYEREGIIHQEVVNLEGYAPTIAVPITDEYIPNIYFSAVLIKGRISEEAPEAGIDSGRPRVRVGYINLPVSAESKKLAVDVTTDKAAASPGDEISVTVKVVDSAGNPVASDAAVMAVDAGSLILTDYKTPNPFSTFYEKVGLAVDTTDSRIHIISRRHYGEKGEPTGGGGAAALLRSKFLPVAYWNPDVTTDENGEAKISFKLPDNLTTFKVMAVADTADMFGSGDAEVISRKPFMLTASLPYFAAVGDEFKAGVTVHNYTDVELAGTVSAGAEGIEIIGDTAASFKVGPGEVTELFFTFKGGRPGIANLSFEAATDAGSDGLRVPLAVKITRPREVFATFGETKKSASELVEPIAEVYADVGGLDVGISSTALTGLTDASLYLIKYPYECLEQKISKAMGMLIYSKIAGEMGIKDPEIASYRQKIEETLFQMYGFQKWGGGLSFWPGLPESPYLTIYATQFMEIARRNGYKIEDGVFKNAKGYLKNLLRWDAAKQKLDQQHLDSLKAYALYTLSLVGEPETAYHEKLYEVRTTLSWAARAQLMMAIKRQGGVDAHFEDFIQAVDNHLQITPAGAHFEAAYEGEGAGWSFQGNDYTNAYILMALMEIRPDHPLVSKIARYLMTGSKRGYWCSTHATAAVLTALYDYIMTREKGVPEFTATVRLGAKELISADFKGRTAAEESAAVPMTELMGLAAPAELAFKKDGKGLLYYRTRLTYASSASPLPPMEEGFTIYRKYGHYGKGGDGEGFERGDIVAVHLDFVLPAARRYVVIEDGLPAGLEAVNFSLATAQQHLAMDMDQKFRIDHVETYGDRVLVFANYLPAGSYQFDYLAKAATKGKFSAPPAHIEEMYNPEVFARTMTGAMEIE